MKITIITSPFGYIPPYGIGAVEKLWYDIGVELSKSKNEITFISKRNKSKSLDSDKPLSNVTRLYIHGYDRSKLVFDLILDFIYSLNALLKLKHCDVLVMNTFWTPFLCRFFRSKYSISMYNVERMPKGQFGLYATVDRFSCVSQAVKIKLCKELPNSLDKIKVINNPINTDVFQYTKKSGDDGSLTIMYHGRIHPEKGLDILVKAFDLLVSKYENIRLVLVGTIARANGGGGPEYRQVLESLSHKEIKFVEPISDVKKLSDMIASCDIYCYPSIAEKGETFGVAPLEAMGVGRPVIVSDLDCFDDFIEDGITGFVFNHRTQNAYIELASFVEKLMVDDKMRINIGYSASLKSKNFSIKMIAENYLNDFKELLFNYKINE